MPSSTYIPTREADLVTWSTNFNAVINADPTAFGLTLQQGTDYTALHDAFVSAYQTSQDPGTRTPTAIVTKNDAKEALIDGPGGIRQLVGIIQNNPATTNAQRSSLGITIPDDDPTPVPVPDTAPVIDVNSVMGRTVSIRLHDAKSPSSRGKPAGVTGATVFSYVGDTPPDEIGEWKFEGSTTRTTVDVEFPATVPAGTKVWLTAFWFNPRQQSGPATTPISTYTNYDGLSQAA